MSQKELEALLQHGIRQQKPKRKGGQSSKMQGSQAECHALDGILDFSRRQSMYGGLSPAYYGPLTDNAQVGLTTFGRGEASGGMVPIMDEGGMVGGFLPIAPIAAALAPAAIGAVGKLVGKMFGKGDYGGCGPHAGLLGGTDGSYFDVDMGMQGLSGGAYGSYFDADQGAQGLSGGADGSYFDVDMGKQGLAGGKHRRGRGKGPVVSTGIPYLPGSQVSSGSGSKNVKDMGRGGKRAPNVWLQHVATVRAENPDTPYKQILQLAKQTYR